MAHEHHHEHHHEHGEAGAKHLIPTLIAALLLVSGLLTEGVLSIVLFGAAYLLAGFSVLKEAVANIFHGEIFDENFLMALASIGALAIGEYEEGIAVMILYQIGEFLQDKAVDSSRRSIQALMDIRPDTARIWAEGKTHEVHAEEVQVGTYIQILAGERVPLDGQVIDGSSALDTAALTGESVPHEIGVGDEVLSGCVNLSGTLIVRVEKPFGESSASKILALVEQASEHKAQPEQFITRFARVYTPIVVCAAVILAFVPPLLGFGAWSVFIKRALNFLVISCPCALVISVPLTFFSGIGRASSQGILIKGGNYLEALCSAEIAAFDKTGTLTEGRFSVSSIVPADGQTSNTLLELAAYAESQSAHPLARSIVSAYGKEIFSERLSDAQERSGHGVSAKLDGKELLCGKADFLSSEGYHVPVNTEAATAVYVAYDGHYCGMLLLCDMPKQDAKEGIASLHAVGIRYTAMLTGDNRTVAESVSREVGVDTVFAELLPEDKVTRLQELKSQLSSKGKLLYCGDGINDTPVLAAADIGIAMGGLGTDAAMEAADVVLMSDEPSKVALAVQIARKTMKIAKQNIVFSIAIKVLVMILSMFGFVNLWAAVFADVGVCMIAILNSLRAMK